MGIAGLLPMLKNHMEYIEVSDLRGLTIGVDGYSWLYKAITVHASDVYLRPADPSVVEKYVSFCIRKCKALQAHNIQLYFVFDGEEHPMKKETNRRRRERKQEVQAKLEALLRRGKMAEAKPLMGRCLKVDEAMVNHLIEALKKIGVPHMIAPYEADPQLVYLEKHGHIDCIATEDSDLIVYGAKRIVFKLNEAHGGEFYNRERILSNCSLHIKCLLMQLKEIVSLSGCDYTDGISKVGLITAHKLIMAHSTVEGAIQHLSKKQGDLGEHIHVCSRVICTFNMHVVKDPKTNKRVHLAGHSEKENLRPAGDASFLGVLTPYS
ncbi:exonuclease 1 [Nematocida major]|uniref:exonuclease 1 n=1 Tax=Nematocida major TaxID=1912982 RepID=UPI002008A496|nr:exonuclease 1 [Nematocida major]KAH9385485.1 exonuclease 1 [Nematocida major]